LYVFLVFSLMPFWLMLSLNPLLGSFRGVVWWHISSPPGCFSEPQVGPEEERECKF
jgi:hypothetical protein